MKKFNFFILVFLFFTTILSAQQVDRNFVVVEIGTGTWCTYCPGAAMGADDLVENGHQVAIIENHNGDSYAYSASNARNTYYGITGYPTAFFDGGNPLVGGSHSSSLYASYLPKYNAAIAVMSDFTLDMSFTHTGNDYSVTLNITEPGDYAGENLKVHLVLTESDIQQNWQGQTELNFVSRSMYPDQNGTAFSGGTQTFTYDFTANGSWDLANCELVAFIQDNSNKAILQADKVTLAEATGTNNVSVLEVEEIPEMCEGIAAPVVKVKNLGSEEITSMTVEYSFNSGTTETFSWTGNIPFNSFYMIELPETTFDILATNTFDVEVTQVNGTTDDDVSNNTGTTSFDKAPVGNENVDMVLHTDGYGSECTWNVKNSEGDILYSGGPYGNNQTINESFVLPAGCNVFNIIDSYGDGGGAITLTDSEGTQLYYTNGVYGSGESQYFTTVLSGPTPPTVGFTPTDGATDILVNSDVVLTFSEAVRLPNNDEITDPAALITFETTAKEDIAFTATINAEKTEITVTPDANLSFSTEYAVGIAAGSVENSADLALENDESTTFTTQDPNSVSELNSDNLKLYPNPFSESLNVEFIISEDSKVKIEIYNILGSVVFSENYGILNNGQHKIAVNGTNLDSGTYTLKIIAGKTVITQNVSLIK